MKSKFLLLIMVLLSLPELWAKTVIVPKRETAKTYYLSLKNLGTQETLKLESKNGKFDLPSDLNGDFSLRISFSDKWGRIIEGEDPKIIKIISKTATPQKDSPETVKDNKATFGLVFTAYSSQGPFQADLGDNSSGIDKIDGTLSGYGVKTILKLRSLPKYFIGLERFQATSAKADLNFTEASIQYQFTRDHSPTPGVTASTGIALNSAQITGQFQDGEDTVKPDIQAASSYAIGNVLYLKRLASVGFQTKAMLGISFNYLRYSFSQTVMYHFSPRFSAGPWIDYARFANGSGQGTMSANLMSLGINLDLSL